MDSILTSVKKILGIDDSYEQFDSDIILHINSVFSILTQMGAGPSTGFSISDKSAIWTDFISSTIKLEFIKSYVGLKVKMLFDPPSNSSVIDATNKIISELEWRIFTETDPIKTTEEENYNGE